MIDYDTIEKKLGYVFSDRRLLETALTHSSFSHDKGNKNNYERLEFVGDALLDYWVGLYLFEHFPDKKEGELTKLRANLVREETLSEICDKLDLMKYLRMSEGQQQNPIFSSRAVRCDVFEAVLGAVLLDSGKNVSVCGKIIEKFVLPYLKTDFTDYKSALYEWAAKSGKQPTFCSETIEHNGEKQYFVILSIDGTEVSTGCGLNKKKAETEACRSYLKNIQK